MDPRSVGGDGNGVGTTAENPGGVGGVVGLSTIVDNISARRWDVQNQRWTSAPWPGGGSCNPETNAVGFGAPIYAPVDGEIVACWREMPDDDIGGDSIRCPGDGEYSGHQCARRGNHVVILTDEGEVVDLNHLQKSSVPTTSARTLPSFCIRTTPVLAFRDASGNLSTVAYGPDANGLLELGTEDGAGAVSDIAVAKIRASTRHAVVGVRNGSGRMQLIPYHVSSSHALTRGGSLVLGRSSAVALTRAPNHTGVVAARINNAGSVTVTDVSVATSGTTLTPTARGSDSANASALAVAVDRVVAGRALDETSGRFRGVVTAERRGDDRLAVRSWSVTSQGVVQREDAYLASFRGAPVYVEDVDVSVVGDGQREVAVVTARERNSDDLLVFTIEISSSGDLDRIGGYEAGSVGGLASATAGVGDVVLGLVSATGTLIELAFGVRSDAETGQVARTGTQRLGTAADAAVAVRAGQGEAVFALQDSTGELQLARHRLNVSDSL